MKPKKKVRLVRWYSGDNSQPFWKRINNVKGNRHDLLYTLGVILQDIEEKVLREIEEIKRGRI